MMDDAKHRSKGPWRPLKMTSERNDMTSSAHFLVSRPYTLAEESSRTKWISHIYSVTHVGNLARQKKKKGPDIYTSSFALVIHNTRLSGKSGQQTSK
ncbi:hypothetical protein HYQ46_012141 [Verticillium longisporum]|nr:hypothetical protein HYQ46_012141 [Verticillium longisporum]